MLSIFFRERTDKMRIIYAEYNMYHNSIDIATYAGFLIISSENKESLSKSDGAISKASAML
jgi:hypothetical protein